LKIIADRKDPLTRGAVCALGGFDGVHRGHQVVIAEAKKMSQTKGRVGVITFTPLPGSVLKSGPFLYLTTDKEKEAILDRLGLDFLYYFSFSADLARREPREFVQLIADKIVPAAVVVGKNFHFGKGRKGTAEHLAKLAGDMFLVRIQPALDDDGVISSTRIRELLLLGNVRAADRLLGRPYSITGPVVAGKKTGQKLGFPTVNVQPAPEKLLPLDGVYRGTVNWTGHSRAGAIFCGHRLVEVHILDFTGDLYGHSVTIEFQDRLRGVEKFPDEVALKKAIAADVAKVRDNG
jgi:riboflavin kinase/FMN adenylyltransferase